MADPTPDVRGLRCLSSVHSSLLLLLLPFLLLPPFLHPLFPHLLLILLLLLLPHYCFPSPLPHTNT